MIDIKPARREELDTINKYLPTNLPNFHENGIKGQEEGLSTWLIAWVDGVPVGHARVCWNGYRNEEVTKIIGVIPHIESVGVAEKYRRQGIGTELTKKAIEMAVEKGFTKIGLAVGATDNPYAKEMYEKLGFIDWGQGNIVDSWEVVENGEKRMESEVCTYLVKNL